MMLRAGRRAIQAVERRVACGAVALVAIIGCGPGTKGPVRYGVEGMVTFRGEPVPMGRIVFEPDPAAGNRGPVGMADIEAGCYATDRRFGAVGGPHLVVIEGFESPGPQGLGPDESPKPLFREYRTTIDLPRQTSTQNFDVPQPSARKSSNR